MMNEIEQDALKHFWHIQEILVEILQCIFLKNHISKAWKSSLNKLKKELFDLEKLNKDRQKVNEWHW